MKLITTITYTFEQNFNNEEVQQAIEFYELPLETIKLESEEFTYKEIINDIETKIDNNGYISNWNRDNVNMTWEE